jgi:hypothetical protein
MGSRAGAAEFCRWRRLPLAGVRLHAIPYEEA